MIKLFSLISQKPMLFYYYWYCLTQQKQHQPNRAQRLQLLTVLSPSRLLQTKSKQRLKINAVAHFDSIALTAYYPRKHPPLLLNLLFKDPKNPRLHSLRDGVLYRQRRSLQVVYKINRIRLKNRYKEPQPRGIRQLNSAFFRNKFMD